jgi:hypothetical protein
LQRLVNPACVVFHVGHKLIYSRLIYSRSCASILCFVLFKQNLFINQTVLGQQSSNFLIKYQLFWMKLVVFDIWQDWIYWVSFLPPLFGRLKVKTSWLLYRILESCHCSHFAMKWTGPLLSLSSLFRWIGTAYYFGWIFRLAHLVYHYSMKNYYYKNHELHFFLENN